MHIDTAPPPPRPPRPLPPTTRQIPPPDRRAAQDLPRHRPRRPASLVETHWSAASPPPRPTTSCSSRSNCSRFRLTLAMRGEKTSPPTPTGSLTPGRIPPGPRRSGDPPHQPRPRDPPHRRAPSTNAPNSAPTNLTNPSATPRSRQNRPETNPKSYKALHPNSTISSPQQEIAPSEAPEEKIPADAPPVPVSHGNPLSLPDHDALIKEVIDLFPHLKGQSEDQILTFLDQFTDPKEQHPQLQPAAAG